MRAVFHWRVWAHLEAWVEEGYFPSEQSLGKVSLSQETSRAKDPKRCHCPGSRGDSPNNITFPINLYCLCSDSKFTRVTWLFFLLNVCLPSISQCRQSMDIDIYQQDVVPLAYWVACGSAPERRQISCPASLFVRSTSIHPTPTTSLGQPARLLGTKQGMPQRLDAIFCLELSASLSFAPYHVGIFLSVPCGTVGARSSFKLWKALVIFICFLGGKTRGKIETCFAGEAFENLELQIVLYCHFQGWTFWDGWLLGFQKGSLAHSRFWGMVIKSGGHFGAGRSLSDYLV